MPLPAPAALARTFTPSVVGAVASFLALFNVDLSTEAELAIGSLVTGVFTLAYYILVSLVSDRWPALGALLGHTATPSYDNGAPKKG